MSALALVFVVALLCGATDAVRREQWASNVSAPGLPRDLALRHGAVVVFSSAGAVTRLDRLTGRVISVSHPSTSSDPLTAPTFFGQPPAFASPATEDYITTSATDIALISARSGRVSWRADLSDAGNRYPALTGVNCSGARAFVATGLAVLVCPTHRALSSANHAIIQNDRLVNRTLFAVALSNGGVEWASAIGEAPMSAASAAPSVDPATGTVVVRVGLGEVAAFSAADGSPLWLIPSDDLVAPPITCGGVAVLVSGNGPQGVSMATGALLWEVSTTATTSSVDGLPMCTAPSAATVDHSLLFMASPHTLARVRSMTGAAITSTQLRPGLRVERAVMDVQNSRLLMLAAVAGVRGVNVVSVSLGQPPVSPSPRSNEFDRVLDGVASVASIVSAAVGPSVLGWANRTSLFVATEGSSVVLCRSFF